MGCDKSANTKSLKITNLAVLVSGCCSAAVVSGLGGFPHLARSYSRTQVVSWWWTQIARPFTINIKPLGLAIDAARCHQAQGRCGTGGGQDRVAGRNNDGGGRGRECESTRTDDGRRRRRRPVVVRSSCVGRGGGQRGLG